MLYPLKISENQSCTEVKSFSVQKIWSIIKNKFKDLDLINVSKIANES